MKSTFSIYQAILEVCLTTKVMTTATSPIKKRNSHYFVQDAPNEFVMSLVELCTEMIVMTHDDNARHRLHTESTTFFFSTIIMAFYRVLLSGLFESSMDFKHCESNSVWERLFLPLSVKLGVRGTY